MKILGRILGVFLLLLILAVAGLYLSGNEYLIKGAYATYGHGTTTATITDKKFFELDTIRATAGKKWFYHPKASETKLSDTLHNLLESTGTAAFIVVKRGVIHYENYWPPYDSESRTNSFSMAKSITTMLVQIAIQNGQIPSWDTPLINYLPELKGPYREELTLRHLSEMTAGLHWEEDYHGPFDITAQTYYGDHIEKLMLKKVPTEIEPGTEFEYSSGATQYLAMALKKATGQSLSAYAEKHLWKPLQAEGKAYWHQDDVDGMAIAYCCFNARALDFARFGALMANYGRYNGKQIVDEDFMRYASTGQAVPHYGQSFWIVSHKFGTPVFTMRGFLGQYIVAIPEKQLTFVRLGERRYPKKDGKHPADFLFMIEEVMRQF